MPRPRAPASIVPIGNRMAVQAIKDEDWRVLGLVPEISNIGDCMRWLATRGLLKNSVVCNNCQIDCTLNAYNGGIDMKRWKCPQCNTRLSVRSGSFFSKSHIELHKIVLIIYFWARKYQQIEVGHELRLDTHHTTVDWYNFLREVCETCLINNAQEIGGAELVNGVVTPKVVEIDESKYFHRKYHRGQWREGHWVFGGIERGTKKCFLIEVQQRDALTLLPLILQWIMPGTHIVSDGWAAYNGIAQLGGGIYTHDVIVHQHHFVDANDPDIHTQNIENMWMRAKRQLRLMFGTSENLFESYLIEFMWRECMVNTNPFSEMLAEIARQYPL